MNILIVAPSSDLEYQADELQTVLNSKQNVRPLVGDVTIERLVLALTNQQHDIVWFMAHSNERGILLSDGNLTTKDLAPLVRDCRLLILNSCTSLAVASAVRDVTQCDVIATIRDIDDRSAFRFGASFVHNLERFNNPQQAFDASIVAGDSDYVYLRSERATLIMDDLTKAMYELKIEIALLRQRVTTLESALTKVPSGTVNERLLWGIIVGNVVLSLLIAYGVYRLAG